MVPAAQQPGCSRRRPMPVYRTQEGGDDAVSSRHRINGKQQPQALSIHTRKTGNASCWLVAIVVVCFLMYSRTKCSSDSLLETVLKQQLGCSSAAEAGEYYDCALSAANHHAARRELVSEQIAAHAQAALERAQLGPIEYDKIPIFVDHHPALVPLDPRYAPNEDWNVDIAIPDIAIVGLAKAGTSQMWRLLVSHPNATGFGLYGTKEFCLMPYEEWSASVEHAWDNETLNMNRSEPTEGQLHVQARLWHFFYNAFFNNTTAAKHRELELHGKLSVNGCYENWDVEITRHYLLPFGKKERNQKYIVLFRDPADLLWSAYNFWKIPGWDRGDEVWAEEGEHYRSNNYCFLGT